MELDYSGENGRTLEQINLIDQMAIVVVQDQYASQLMVLYWLLIVWISLFVYGIQRQDKKKPSCLVIMVGSIKCPTS
ncbi:unnamed protein product [Paramecium pentaurelia]|uniref:Uncharacterized protein n=1 Tax=Paramecium pentaurelia TaxID=43138 RepID=A0A8S1YJV5_9CILI|nr:unnamed protein product [Paramecium pentaurelia]